MQQKNVFLLDTCFWLISAIIIYLIYPIIYCIIWAMSLEKITSVKDLINIDHNVASLSYGGLAGMLVATVKWAGISIREDQTAYALEILERATAERRKADDVVERYNRRFNH
jgi:hypothetical protein